MGLVWAFKDDPRHDRKVCLAQGSYRGDDGKPLVLDVVRKVEAELAADTAVTKCYAPIEGLPVFRTLAAKLCFGEAEDLTRIVSVQTLSGTGALRLCGDFLRLLAGTPAIAVSAPTWGNHHKIFKAAGLRVESYPYVDSQCRLDFPALTRRLEGLEEGTAVLLHACCHNPTGVDPSPGQWQALAELCLRKKLVPLIDAAYQGYATGDVEQDAQALRIFMAAGCRPLVAQSFAKSMGLYGERAGAMHVVCGSPAEAERVVSAVKGRLVRPMYSSPPIHGARLVERVLADPANRRAWFTELQGMVDRIRAVRRALVDALVRGDGGDDGASGGEQRWGHLRQQCGMFAWTGLTAEQVAAMKTDHAVYMTADGRASIASLASKDVAAVAKAMLSVVAADRKVEPEQKQHDQTNGGGHSGLSAPADAKRQRKA